MTKRKPKAQRLAPHIVVVEVDNPTYQPQHHGAVGNPKTVRAQLSMRESPAVYMWQRKIIDEAQYRAASKFRQLYEATGGAGVRAFDYGREPVDGGIVSDGLTQHRLDAANELRSVYQWLGHAGYDLTQSICGQCFWPGELYPSSRPKDRAMKQLRACLDTLAIHWGFVRRPSHRLHGQPKMPENAAKQHQ